MPVHVQDRALRFQGNPLIKAATGPVSVRSASPVDRLLSRVLLGVRSVTSGLCRCVRCIIEPCMTLGTNRVGGRHGVSNRWRWPSSCGVLGSDYFSLSFCTLVWGSNSN